MKAKFVNEAFEKREGSKFKDVSSEEKKARVNKLHYEKLNVNEIINSITAKDGYSISASYSHNLITWKLEPFDGSSYRSEVYYYFLLDLDEQDLSCSAVQHVNDNKGNASEKIINSWIYKHIIRFPEQLEQAIAELENFEDTWILQ